MSVMIRKALFPLTLLFIIFFSIAGCRKEPIKINYKLGLFPDSVIALEALNSPYNDYNVALEAGIHEGHLPLLYSSDRGSQGADFDLVHGLIEYTFGQTTGNFRLTAESRSDPFLDLLGSAFNNSGDQLGPYRFFNRTNGLEYITVASSTDESGLDLFYLNYIPAYPALPTIGVPVAATLFNSVSDDAYLTLNVTLDTAWFCSDRGGDFDIYTLSRPAGLTVDEWLTSAAADAVAVGTLNSEHNEKCPSVEGRYMVFASDMPGGFGGYDLWYSIFHDGQWSAPVNMGQDINTPHNEYRPVLGRDNRFENHFLIFSSDRPGGKGGYDLYFTGVTFPE